MAIKNGKMIVGIGRIHIVDVNTAQIRYMAVHENYQQQNIGALLLDQLEQVAQKKGVKKVVLNSRELACGFYVKQEYRVVEFSHMLYGLIPHYLMEKSL
jgi:ribosomal protein S18 acetylase RimI-like enzyme